MWCFLLYGYNFENGRYGYCKTADLCGCPLHDDSELINIGCDKHMDVVELRTLKENKVKERYDNRCKDALILKYMENTEEHAEEPWDWYPLYSDDYYTYNYIYEYKYRRLSK